MNYTIDTNNNFISNNNLFVIRLNQEGRTRFCGECGTKLNEEEAKKIVSIVGDSKLRSIHSGNITKEGDFIEDISGETVRSIDNITYGDVIVYVTEDVSGEISNITIVEVPKKFTRHQGSVKEWDLMAYTFITGGCKYALLMGKDTKSESKDLEVYLSRAVSSEFQNSRLWVRLKSQSRNIGLTASFTNKGDCKIEFHDGFTKTLKSEIISNE